MKTEAPTPLTEAAERVARYAAALSEGQTQTAALEAAYGPIANLRSRGQTFVDATDKLCADLRSLLAERAALAEERDRLAGALEPFRDRATVFPADLDDPDPGSEEVEVYVTRRELQAVDAALNPTKSEKSE